MSVPDKLLELVDRFQYHIDDYKSGKYNETQVRRDFIDPLFGLLGWDVDNKANHAEAYREVIHEDSIKIGGATKAPDYGFRVGGTRKFFLEAKKPSINIKEDVASSFQLRRYGWSARLPISILTDFEEFAVYDTRIKPSKTDKVAKARIDYIYFTDYPDKWQHISDTFSKDAVYKGSFDKYVETTKIKKGTAQVDSSFLAEIESWRDALARNLMLRNPGLTSRNLNFSVQAIIDRIIFLRMCEDRGIESYGKLQALKNGTNTYSLLCQQFKDADARYNSGLFHFQEENNRPTEADDLTLTLNVDDKVLKDIFKNLYYPDSPFEFSVLPTEILGEVYEQFLGKVIQVKGKRATVEEKPEVKKAGGVYYTPKYIVDYIVQNTVGQLLEGKKPGKGVDTITILDPACGSGSFLLGAYQYLLDWYRDQYEKAGPEKHRKVLYKAGGNEWRLTTDERKRILLTHIHGVDIDPQAVEVTKLSLLLKVLEGESDETLRRQTDLFKKRVLPDLGGNIKCGNSLIGPDFYHGQQMSFVDEEEQYRINAFDWDMEFKSIMQFGGFDVVIGNPPYVVLTKDMFLDSVLEYLEKYDVSQYKYDLFHIFMQKGIQNLSKRGLLGFIVPNQWLTQKFTDKLRKYILSNTNILEIVIFRHFVFQAANVHTCLIFLEKNGLGNKNNIIIKQPHDFGQSLTLKSLKGGVIGQKTWIESDGNIFETRLTGKKGEIVSKIKNNSKSLDEVARASLGCQAYNSSKHSLQEIKKRIFHADQKLSKDYLPELAGSDVSRYKYQQIKGQWIKYGPWLHDYRTIDWLQGPRILIREIVGKTQYKILGCYIEETYCNYKTILNVNPTWLTSFSMKYLLALINSKLMSFVYPLISNKIIASSFPRITVGDVKKLPIRSIDLSVPKEKTQHDQMVSLVESMLELNKQLDMAKTAQDKTHLQRRIDATDKEIDQIVYQLYDLTEEEIKIVEESTQ